MSDEDYWHLFPSIRPIAHLEDHERIENIRHARWIEHPSAKRILDRIEDLCNQPRSTRSGNLLITGRSGAGKTSIINRLRRSIDTGPETRNITPRSLVFVMMPPNPDEKEFFLSMAAGMHMAVVELSHLEGHRLREKIIKELRSRNTRGVVIDEFNSVLVGTARQQRRFLQLLRYLSNEIEASLICVGTPEARQSLITDEQLQSRFSSVDLPPWEAADENLQIFIANYVQHFPLRNPSPVVSKKICSLLAYRSDGITDSICKALTRAAVNAVLSGSEMIDYASLKDERVWEGMITIDPPYVPRSAARAKVSEAPP